MAVGEVDTRVARIYALYDPRFPDDVRYVGKTVRTLELRLKAHISRTMLENTNTHKCNWIRSIVNQGFPPSIQLLLEVPALGWQDVEIDQIRLHKELGHDLTNGTLGGDGVVCTEEVRAKMSAAQMGNTKFKGKKHSPESIEKTRQANIGIKRGPHSDEHKAKIGAKSKGNKHNLGRKASEETKDKQRASSTGRLHTDETKEKMRISATGRVMSPESVEKSRQANLGRKLSPESIAKRTATLKINNAAKKLANEILREAEDGCNNISDIPSSK